MLENEITKILLLFLVVRWLGCTMDPRVQEKLILKIIFQHLLMFQYYKDLKEHDDSISSFFKCEPKENKKVLDYKFLRIWVEKCAIRKSENKKLQRLESRNVGLLLEPLKEKEFIKLFSENSEITTEEISWENAEVPNKVLSY